MAGNSGLVRKSNFRAVDDVISDLVASFEAHSEKRKGDVAFELMGGGNQCWYQEWLIF